MSTATISIEPAQRELLEQAAEWRLIGLLFECPSPAWKKRVAAIASEVNDKKLCEAAKLAAAEASEALYHSTLGPGGPAAPREVSHRRSVEAGFLMSEIAAFHDAFVYRPETLEAPDHVSVEAGFVGYLKLKEAYARACGDGEHAAVTAEAAKKFQDEHLTEIAEPLAKGLKNSGIRYLELTSESLLKRVGPKKTSASNPPEQDPDFPILCG